MYRTQIVLTFYSLEPVTRDDVEDLTDHVQVDGLGLVSSVECQQCTRREAALMLKAAEKDPDFLFEEAWVYALTPGDEVRIDSAQPDDTGSVIIQTIEYQEHEPYSLDDNLDTVVIVTQEGERIECLVNELY